MADLDAHVPWSADQWNRIRQVVYEEARAARVAGNLLPIYGPLGSDVLQVACPVLQDPGPARSFTVEDSRSLKLATLQTRVSLRAEQMADPELASAQLAFRRAANVLARLEDDIIFNGQAGEDRGPKRPGSLQSLNDPWEVVGGQESNGLLPAPTERGAPVGPRPHLSIGDLARLGASMVSVVSAAVGSLEERYHLGPFICVLDPLYFNAVQTPNASSLVLPQDRILPFLGGGALLRSSALRSPSGLVIAVGGAPVDLAVGTEISVEFLQITEEPLSVFRVFERLVLRIKEPRAICPIEIPDLDGVPAAPRV